MSLVTFYFKDTPRGNIGGISVDATISDTTSYPSEIPQYPVEDGSFISDNITNHPYGLEIRGIITDSPLKSPSTDENSGFNDSSNSRVKNAYEDLLTLRNEKIPFDVVTGLDIFEDVFFTSLDIVRDPDTGEALAFSATFQQIIFATPSTIPIPREKVKIEKKDFAQSDVNKGAEQVSDAETKRQSVSILYKLFGSRYSQTGVVA